jgi:predicted O-methyltransferase YrrM
VSGPPVFDPPPPERVRRAMELAEAHGFPLLPEGRPVGYAGPPSACIPQVGRLLAALVAARPGGRIGEHGSGVGVGTAWMASALPPDATLVSAELDPERARLAAGLFEDLPNVEIRTGDCVEVLADRAPFDLLFADAGARDLLQPEHWDRVTEWVTIGGTLVFDDLKPLEQWPREWWGQVDRKRAFAFHNPRVRSAEIRTTATEVALLVTRVR